MSERDPSLVTFTGVDEHTDVGAMLDIQSRWPVEWGVLFSPSRQGAGRYPPLPAVRALEGRGLRLAAHVCGAYAEEVVATGACAALSWIPQGMFGRVQVNTADPKVRPSTVAAFARSLGAARGILQCRDAFPEDVDVSWLYDASGGRGRLPGRWPAPSEHAAFVGYAGGLGPDTVASALEAIKAANARGVPYWIDMETRVRDASDRLDLEACLSVLRAVMPERRRDAEFPDVPGA